MITLTVILILFALSLLALLLSERSGIDLARGGTGSVPSAPSGEEAALTGGA